MRKPPREKTSAELLADLKNERISMQEQRIEALERQPLTAAEKIAEAKTGKKQFHEEFCRQIILDRMNDGRSAGQEPI